METLELKPRHNVDMMWDWESASLQEKEEPKEDRWAQYEVEDKWAKYEVNLEIQIDEHTGKQIPVLRQNRPLNFMEKVKDYMGIRPPKTTPLELEAIKTGKTPYDIREEVFGTGKTEEVRRVVSRGMAGLTGGLTDLIKGVEERPETVAGTVVGAGAELAGFLVGPFKWAKGITGTRLAPTATGLKGMAQLMAQGGANLGIASGIASIIPTFMGSSKLSDMGVDIIEHTALGGLIGAIFPGTSVIPTKPLRISVGMAIIDKIRAGFKEWFTIDDVIGGIRDGTIDKKELAERSFGYLMDLYFLSKVPSLKKQLDSLRFNKVVDEMARLNGEEIEGTIIELGRQNLLYARGEDGIRPLDAVRQWGTDQMFKKTFGITQELLYHGRKEIPDYPHSGWYSTSLKEAQSYAKTASGKGKPVVDVHRPSDFPESVFRLPGEEYDVSPSQYFKTQKRLGYGENFKQPKPIKTIDVIESQFEGLARAKAVERMYNQADAELEALRKPSLQELRQAVVRATIDVSGTVKRQLLEKGGELGKQAVIRHDLLYGVDTKVERMVSDVSRDIYGGLSKAEEFVLNRIIQSRRTIAIEQYKEGVKHPGGLTGEDHRIYLDSIPKELYGRLNQRADLYFSEMNKQLKELHKHGLISVDSFEAMIAKGDYSPRRFIQHIDPERSFTFEGRKITVPDSGIKALAEGSERTLENNSRLLLSDVIARTQSRIFRNEANKALYELADKIPENSIVIKPKKGEKPSHGMETISVIIDGQKKEMFMPSNLAKEWILRDPAIDTQLANIVGWLSGSKILKPMATGLNPEFALTNMPRDIMHVWLTTHEYSRHAPVWAAQMGKDFAETAKDAIFRGKGYGDYINEGGGMSFLTHQGRLGKMGGVWGDIQKVLGYMGETSEIWTRLALRNRALKNNKAPHEATWVARTYLDFSQGGNYIKAADSAIPYLNAGIQASRGILRSGREQPKEFVYKVAQLAGISIGLYLANKNVNPEAWDAISDRDKVNNFIITTPLSYYDENGDKRYLYFKVAKDQGHRIISTMFEGLTAKFLEEPFDIDQVIMAAQDFIPIVPTDLVPPSFSAIMGYFANTDFWRNEKIWKGPQVIPREEYTRFTHPALVEMGQLTGLSPEKTGHFLSQYFTSGNIYTSTVGVGLANILNQLPEGVRDTTTTDILNQTPFLRRVLKSTDPYTPFKKELEELKLEDSTRKYVQRRTLDEMSEVYYEKKEPEQLGRIRNFINSAPIVEREDLIKRFEAFGKLHKIPDRRWWLDLKAMSPEARATAFWIRWNLADKDEKVKLETYFKEIPGIATERVFIKLKELNKSEERTK